MEERLGNTTAKQIFNFASFSYIHRLCFDFEFCLQNYIILPDVLCGCESWSLTLREEYRLRVFENKVLRRIFGPKREEVTGEWRRLHNKELYAVYSSPNIIRVIK
jgi:hypothetical protein